MEATEIKSKRGEGMYITPQVRKEIRKALIDRDITMAEFADMCGRHKTIVSNAINGWITVSPHIQQAIKDTLGIDVTEK